MCTGPVGSCRPSWGFRVEIRPEGRWLCKTVEEPCKRASEGKGRGLRPRPWRYEEGGASRRKQLTSG